MEFRLVTWGCVARNPPPTTLPPMSAFTPLPLGCPIPGSVHSVSCSLPTLADIIGYEERDPAVTARMQAGYPRFALHPFVRQLIAALTAEVAQAGEQLWPLISARAAETLVAQLGGAPARHVRVQGVEAVLHPAGEALAAQAKLWLQHTGTLLSSRGAEDALVRLGRLPAAGAETTFKGDAALAVRRVLGPCFPGAERHLHLAPSGMSAIHAAFRAVGEVQAPRGRTAWVQLGWLYLDTIALLKKFTPDPAHDHLVLHDVRDLAALEQLLAAHGPRIAGLITEAPTNPLLHTADLAAVAALARRHGVRVIVDPAIASPFNVDVLPHADIVAFSLTKYASHEGDVMAGAAVVNPAGPDAAALQTRVAAGLDAPYPRDLARLAAEIGSAAEVVARINANTPQVVAFLESHPAVDRVWWSLQEGTAANYRRLARRPEAVGAVVSFTLKRPIASFYDRVPLAKGPSFGMRTTLLCPYIYLAHYDLLPHRGGGGELARAGLVPELLRLSVGIEPVYEIIAALDEALGA